MPTEHGSQTYHRLRSSTKTGKPTQSNQCKYNMESNDLALYLERQPTACTGAHLTIVSKHVKR
eukprot:4216693-Amphidinium_carterae.1